MSLPNNEEVTPANAVRAINSFRFRDYEDPEIKEIAERILGHITNRERREPSYSQPRTKRLCELMLDRL